MNIEVCTFSFLFYSKQGIKSKVWLFISRIRFPSAIRLACIFRLVIKFCNVRQKKREIHAIIKGEKIKRNENVQ